MKSIRANPTNHAPEGDERIRTAVGVPGADPVYERRWELSILVGPCDYEAAEELLLAVEHKFGDHLGAAYALRTWDEDEAAS